MRAIVSLFFFALCSSAPLAAPPEYPDPLTSAQLREIIEKADPEGALPGRLVPAHLFPEPTSITLEVRIPKKRMSEQEIRIQTKASGAEYLVMERRTSDGDLLQTDVLRYHWVGGFFHRWTIWPDPKAPVRFLMGERFLNESTRDKRAKERENHPRTLEILWRDLGGQPSQTTLQERYGRFPGGGKAYQFTMSETQKGERTRREFAVYFKPAKPVGPLGQLPNPLPDFLADLTDPDLLKGPAEGGLFDLRFENGDFGNDSDQGLYGQLEDDEEDKPSQGAIAWLKQKMEDLRQGQRNDLAPGDGKPAKEVFEKLNFSYQLEVKDYLKLDPKRVNPAAALCYFSNRSQSAFFVIAENGGMGLMNTRQLSDVAIERLKALLENPREGESKTVAINEVPFLVKSISGGKGPLKLSYTVAVASHNGHLIQLIYHQPGEDPVACEKQGLLMAKGFRFLDREKKVERRLLSGNSYQNQALGLKFDPGKVGAKFWNIAQVWQQFPAASYGTLLSPDEGMIVVPLDLHGLNLSEDDLAEVLLAQTGLNYQNQIQRKIPVTQGTSKGVEYHSRVRLPQATMVYRARILRNKETAVMLSAFAPDRPGFEEKLKNLLDGVEISAPLPFGEREKISEHRKRDALLLRLFGIHFLSTQRAEEALPFCERSWQIAPDDLAVITNLLTARRFGGDPSGALALFREAEKKFPDNLTLKSHQPFLLLDLSRQDEAATAFAELFDQGYQDEGALLEYLNLLNLLGRMQQAKEAIDGYLERFPAAGIQPKRWQYQVYARAEDFEGALSLSEKLAKEFPDLAEVQQDLIIALIDAGKTEQAIGKLEIALKAQPQNAFLHFQKGRAFQVAEDYQKAREAYEQASKLAPDSVELKNAIARVSAMLGQGDQAAIRQKIEPAKIPEEVARALEQAEEEGTGNGFNHRVLTQVVVYRFKKGRRFKTTNYRNIRVFNQGGVEETKTIRFSFDPTFERAYLNEVEVVAADGRIVSRGEGVESYVSDVSARDGAMGTTQSVVTATVPGLEPGCRLRYSYTVESLGPVEMIPFKSDYFASLGAGGAMAMVVTGDLQEIGAITRNKEFEVLEGEGYRAWLQRKVPTFYLERLQPPLEQFLPFVAMGDQSKTWHRLGLDYLNKVKDRLTVSPQIKELAGTIVGTAENETEKADAIMRYVQDQLVYQAIEFGRRARVPSRAEVISQNRYGDCKDHSLLAFQLLKASGVPAHLTLVHTEGGVVKELPSLDQFNHMIVYLPSIRGGTFFDGTEKNASVKRSSPTGLAGKQALILDDAPDDIVTIPFDASEVHSVRSSRTVIPDTTSMNFQVEEELVFRGSVASVIRLYLLQSNKAEWTRLMESVLGSNQPIAIQSFEPTEIRNPDVPLKIKMKYEVRNLLKKKGASLESAVPAIWEQFFLLRNRSGLRRSPFEILTPLKFHSKVTLKLPENYRLSEGSWKPTEEDRKMVKWMITRLSPSAFESSLSIKNGRYPAREYKTYTDSLGEALDQIKGSLALLPVR